MISSTSSSRITKTSLTLGSAVAIAGLVAAFPAQASTSNNPCNGKNSGSKSASKTDHVKVGHTKMGHTKTDHTAMSKQTTKSSNSAACSGK